VQNERTKRRMEERETKEIKKRRRKKIRRKARRKRRKSKRRELLAASYLRLCKVLPLFRMSGKRQSSSVQFLRVRPQLFPVGGGNASPQRRACLHIADTF
jgi:hypothetical protein